MVNARQHCCQPPSDAGPKVMLVALGKEPVVFSEQVQGIDLAGELEADPPDLAGVLIAAVQNAKNQLQTRCEGRGQPETLATALVRYTRSDQDSG